MSLLCLSHVFNLSEYMCLISSLFLCWFFKYKVLLAIYFQDPPKDRWINSSSGVLLKLLVTDGKIGFDFFGLN